MSATDIQFSHTLLEVGELLVKHHGLHEGFYEVALELQVGVGAIGPTPESRLPGAMIGFSKVGLRKVDKLQPLVIDAAKVNPPTSKKARRT